MQSPESPTDVNTMIMQFMMNDMTKVTDDKMRARLTTLLSNPNSYEQIVKTANFIYLVRESAPNELLELGTGLFYFANKHGFSELWKDNRGVQLIEALRRQLGETPPAGTTWPDPSDDPAPVPDYGPGGWSEAVAAATPTTAVPGTPAAS